MTASHPIRQSNMLPAGAAQPPPSLAPLRPLSLMVDARRCRERGLRIAGCLLLASLAPGSADPAPVIHYAPTENLEHIDVDLIDRAEH
jgi:hypothetical protein